MAESPIEVRRAEALRDIVRAQRQVANALDSLRSSDEDERGAAMIALEHAHVKLGGALADFYGAADVALPESEGDEAADTDELQLRRLHAAVEALEQRAAQEPATPGHSQAGEGSQVRAPGAAGSTDELARLIAQVARDVESVRAVVAESATSSLERRLAGARLIAVEDRLVAAEQRLRILEGHLIETGGGAPR